MSGRWRHGDVIARREVVEGRPWLVTPVTVVADEPDLLAVYLAPGTPLVFPPGGFPRGAHPWSSKTHWQGNGVLQLHRPGDWHTVWVFWQGAERRFHGWYVNFQEPLRRTAFGIDTRDLELDLWIPREGPWEWKDAAPFQEQVRAGFISSEEAAAVQKEAERLTARLEAGKRWWDGRWADWTPDPAWPVPESDPAWVVP